MQPLAGSDATGLVIGADRSRNMKPINVNDWANMKIDNVDVGERFFYNYFMAKSKRDGAASKKKDTPKTGDFDEDGLDEDAVWKALVSSKPDVEADDDDDLNMSDFSDFDEDEEDEDEVDLEDDEEEAVASKGKPAVADDESDDDMGLDDENRVCLTLTGRRFLSAVTPATLKTATMSTRMMMLLSKPCLKRNSRRPATSVHLTPTRKRRRPLMLPRSPRRSLPTKSQRSKNSRIFLFLPRPTITRSSWALPTTQDYS